MHSLPFHSNPGLHVLIVDEVDVAAVDLVESAVVGGLVTVGVVVVGTIRQLPHRGATGNTSKFGELVLAQLVPENMSSTSLATSVSSS